MDEEEFDESLTGLCKECNAHTLFLVKGGHSLYHEPSGIHGEYVLGVCKECNFPSLFMRTGEGHDLPPFYRVYPPNKRQLHFSIPEQVKIAYDQAVKCEENNLWIACVPMIGRALEAIIKEYSPGRKRVVQGLKELKAQGVISSEIYQWADKLRLIRNIGAHVTGEKVTKADAVDSLDFLQVIMETLYHLRPKYEAMKQRREST